MPEVGSVRCEVGLAYLPLAVALTVSARASARLLPKWGPRALLVGGLVLTAAGMGWLALLTRQSGFVVGVLGPTVVVGLGQGAVLASATMAGTAGVPMNRAGLASGLINATRQLGGAIGLAGLAAVAAAKIAATPGPVIDGQAAGYVLALGIGAAIAAVAVLAALAAPGRARPA